MSDHHTHQRVTPHTAESMVRGKLPLSVHILTFQSEETLPRALGSVSEAREILVIDGGSTDRTVQIAEAAGALVVPQRPKEKQGTPTKDFSGARNVGLKSTSEEWILALDSDEYASEELMTEIRTIIAAGTKCACYIPRRYMLKDGRKVTHATTYPNERIYFFHRDTVKQWIKPVHERVELVRGTQTKHLKGASLAPLGSLQEYRRKNARYLTLEQARWKDATFGEWFVRVFLRTLKSRIIATIRLVLIWILPHGGTRLPLSHELLRYWYAAKMLVATFPRKHPRSTIPV